MLETTDERRLLTPEQLSDELQVPVATVKHWRRYGIGPVVTRVGKHVRYQRRDVDAWLASQREPRA